MTVGQTTPPGAGDDVVEPPLHATSEIAPTAERPAINFHTRKGVRSSASCPHLLIRKSTDYVGDPARLRCGHEHSRRTSSPVVPARGRRCDDADAFLRR